MTQLETLIQTLCPNGVPKVRLGDVVNIIRGERVTKKELSDKAPYPVVSGGSGYMGRYDKYNRNENTITIAQYGTAGYIAFRTEKFWANDICYSVIPSQVVDNKFVYYVLVNMQNYIYTLKTEAIPACMPLEKLQELQIPLPPLAVQSEIVRVLDKFTLHKSELAAELAARLQQYEYYRDKLLTFDDTVKRVKLGEVGFYPTERIAINEVESYVGVENLLKDRNGVEFLEKTPKMDVAIQFLPNDILIGNIRPYLKKIWIADRMGGTNGDVVTVRIKPEYIDKLNPKYLYHQLASDAFFNYDNINAKGAKMPRGDKNAILQYPIPLPSLSEQERIVSILDRFDTLCHDIREGLPAEIELRQKQYEHYRDKLLTFEAKG